MWFPGLVRFPARSGGRRRGRLLERERPAVGPDKDRAVLVGAPQGDAERSEQLDGLGVRVAELVAGRHAGNRQPGAGQREPVGVSPVPAAVVRQLQDIDPVAKLRRRLGPPATLTSLGVARQQGGELAVFDPKTDAVVVLVVLVSRGLGKHSEGDRPQLDLASRRPGTDRRDVLLLDRPEQGQVVRRDVRRVGIEEHPGVERPDHRGHPAVVVLVMMADDDEVDRPDATVLEQPDDLVRRPGVN